MLFKVKQWHFLVFIEKKNKAIHSDPLLQQVLLKDKHHGKPIVLSMLTSEVFYIIEVDRTKLV